MRGPHHPDLSAEDRRRFAAGLIAALLLAGIVVNCLAALHRAAGLSFF
jgi:hypothetical protein